MMGITEKAAHLQGLAEGLAIDDSTKEGKLLLALLDIVSEMADAIADLEDSVDEIDEAIEDLETAVSEMDEVIEVLDEDLNAVESVLEEELDDLDEDDYDEDDFDESALYEIVCPNCNDSIYLDEGMLEEGSMDCPNCGQLLEFDFEETDCDCGCHNED